VEEPLKVTRPFPSSIWENKGEGQGKGREGRRRKDGGTEKAKTHHLGRPWRDKLNRVRHEHASPALQQRSLHALLVDMRRRMRIHRTQHIIQQQQARPAIHCSGKRDARLLSAGESDSFLADFGLVAVFE
jgi:hypothetical protein